MTNPVQRKRAGTYATFDRRYAPVVTSEADGTIYRDWDDPIFKDVDEHYVWTIVEGDKGTLYLVPGLATVNYLYRVLCAKPWPEEEVLNPGYVY